MKIFIPVMGNICWSEDGVDYVVEALAGGVVMTPADKFVNEAEEKNI